MSPHALPPDVSDALQELGSHYEDFNALDRGGNGYLFFARNQVTAAEVAIKFYAVEKSDRGGHEEPRLLATVTNRNVLQILEARVVSEEWAFFVTPRCFGGDLDDCIAGKPSVHEAIDIALGICSGVSSLHALDLVHRDLKPANIVLNDGIPQIADFGSVAQISVGELEVSASRHSVLYRPPESFETDRYSKLGDIYQVGLVVFQLLGGDLPYSGPDYFNRRDVETFRGISDPVDRRLFEDEVIGRRAKNGTLVDLGSLPGWIDNVTKRKLRRMVNPNASLRPQSIADVAADLNSMRLQLGDWMWSSGAARLTRGPIVIELRPKNDGEYVAYKDSGNGFRRIPRLAAGELSDLTAQVML